MENKKNLPKEIDILARKGMFIFLDLSLTNTVEFLLVLYLAFILVEFLFLRALSFTPRVVFSSGLYLAFPLPFFAWAYSQPYYPLVEKC